MNGRVLEHVEVGERAFHSVVLNSWQTFLFDNKSHFPGVYVCLCLHHVKEFLKRCVWRDVKKKRGARQCFDMN